jgi:hypothetical protein
MGLVLALCWGLAAASYAHNELGWRTGGFEAADRGEIRIGYRGGGALSDFRNNAIEQLNNLPQVISHTLSHAWWVIILFVVLETLTVVIWIILRAIEKEFARDTGHKRD